MTEQVNRLIVKATAGRVKPRTHAKLLAIAEATREDASIRLEPEDADEVSLALGHEFWRRFWELFPPPQQR